MNLRADKCSQFVTNGGGALPKKLLRKHYVDSLFLLIKAYKRYYLGIWILKLPFYKNISNKDKTQKWQEKRKKRYEFLESALKEFKSIHKIYPQMKIWLSSKEFKEKYLDTNHPYPPLLNPQNIDYESISADLAWKMNLPLPPHYHFMYFSNGSQASATTMLFFKECGIGLKDFYCSPKHIYCGHFNFFLSQEANNKNCLFFYTAFMTDILLKPHSDAEKLLYLCSQKVPLIYIARDPIALLKGYLNHMSNDGYIVAKLAKKFNITCDYSQILHTPIYVNHKNIPSFEVFDNKCLLKDIIVRSFMFDSIIKILQDKIPQIHCIEFNDLKSDKGFDTFCKLSDNLKIDRPKNNNFIKAKLGGLARGTLTALPITLYVHPDDLSNIFREGIQSKVNLASLDKKDGFSIIITLPYTFGDELPDYLKDGLKDFVNITDEIQKDLIIDDIPILIFIKKMELNQLQSNLNFWDATKEYLKGYINALQNHATKIKANLITEEQVLKYFRTNDSARQYAKQTLDNELYYIKKHHPDFIQSWKYYLEFEKICAELD